MPDFVWMIIFLAGWFALQMWILPRFGISTCMSGACRVPEPSDKKEKEKSDERREIRNDGELGKDSV